MWILSIFGYNAKSHLTQGMYLRMYFSFLIN